MNNPEISTGSTAGNADVGLVGGVICPHGTEKQPTDN
jgi:hypothetical protein